MTRRSDMLSSTVRDEIAPVLKSCPPECGIVSITRVEISPDSSYATAYISALQNLDAAMEFLRKETPNLQRILGRLPRKRIPLLRFKPDKVVQHGARIDALLEEASKDSPGDS